MKERIQEYLKTNLASAADCDAKNDIIEELSDNLEEKYEDLIAQGKSEEDAYQEVIGGVGDLSEVIKLINRSPNKKCGTGNFSMEESLAGFEGIVKDLVSDLKPVIKDAARGFQNAFRTVGEAASTAARAEKSRYDTAISAAELRGVNVRTRSGHVTFGLSDSDTIYVVEYSNAPLAEENRARIENVDGFLHIEQGGRGAAGFVFFGFGLLESNFEVFLPQRIWDSINVTTMSGKTDIRFPLRTRELTIQSISGGLTTETIECEKLAIKEVSGNVELSGRVGDLTLATTSGNIRMNLTEAPNAMSMDTVSGEIKVTMPDCDGFTVDFRKVSGNITGEFPMIMQMTDHGGRGVYREDGRRIYSLKTVSGNLKLLRTEKGE